MPPMTEFLYVIIAPENYSFRKEYHTHYTNRKGKGGERMKREGERKKKRERERKRKTREGEKETE
jgi:hypothetical protein